MSYLKMHNNRTKQRRPQALEHGNRPARAADGTCGLNDALGVWIHRHVQAQGVQWVGHQCGCHARTCPCSQARRDGQRAIFSCQYTLEKLVAAQLHGAVGQYTQHLGLTNKQYAL